jgi:hypothetical protein
MSDVVLLHPMKTAGSALLKMLKQSGGVHSSGHNINTAIKPDDFVILPVRNPYTRVHSMYYWVTIPRRQKRKRTLVKRTHPESFEQFVVNFPPDWDIIRYGVADNRLFSTCSGMIDDLSRVDFICRFENIEEDSKKLMMQLNREGCIEKVNKNRRKKPFSMDVYTPEMIGRINEVFSDDFENFGYEKVDP